MTESKTKETLQRVKKSIVTNTKKAKEYMIDDTINDLNKIFNSKKQEVRVPWVVNGVCKKEEISPDAICNLGYACDGCPYNANVRANRYLKVK